MTREIEKRYKLLAVEKRGTKKGGIFAKESRGWARNAFKGANKYVPWEERWNWDILEWDKQSGRRRPAQENMSSSSWDERGEDSKTGRRETKIGNS